MPSSDQRVPGVLPRPDAHRRHACPDHPHGAGGRGGRERRGTYASLGQLLGSVRSSRESEQPDHDQGDRLNPVVAAGIANGFAEGIVSVRTQQFQEEVQTTIQRLQGQINAIPAALRDSAQSVSLQQNVADLRALLGTQDPTLRIATPAEPPGSATWPRPALTISSPSCDAPARCGPSADARARQPARQSRRRAHLRAAASDPRARSALAQAVVRDYLANRKPLPHTPWEAYRTLRMNLAAAMPNGPGAEDDPRHERPVP